MKNYLKRTTTFFLALLMLLSVPLQAFAEINGAGSNENNSKQKEINYDETPIVKEHYINKAELPVIPAKADKPATEYVANPQEPKLYNIKFDYKVQRGDDQIIAYQPYIATVGEKATDDDKEKMKRNLKYPILDGYTSPTKEANLSYDYIVKHSDKKDNKIVWNSGYRAQFYKPKDSIIKVKHVFQDFEKPSEYGKLPGHDEDIITEQTGVTGTSLKIQPIPERDRVGYIPESNDISTQVPENIEDFEVEYRYNRANFNVTFNTGEGTPIPARTLYYAQKIPKIDEEPTKIGSDFLGWKPSVDISTKDGKTFKANEIIKVATGGAIKNLDANLIMPGSKVTFTAVWKDKDKADYAVQFWAEKADHADGASLADKYDYIGTRVYKDQATGLRPDLDKVSVKDIVFTDLDQARLNKIWAGARFNRGKDLYLNKFYVYNQDLTHDQNADPKNTKVVKSVDSTGKTVYNIYYDRQVYDLYFTKSNAQPAGNTFYPEIWGYDEAKGEVVKKGGPGNPYHYKARFNQLMLGWPNDAMQTKGFSKGMQSFGWGPNYTKANWPGYLDTPPYRLNADQFLDMPNYDTWGGYAKPIDKGDGTSIPVDKFDFTTLSFGINQAEGSMPHHMDFWMDGFKPGETIIRYDLYRFKADTNSESYRPKYPKVQGFTGKRDKEPAEFLDEAGIDDKNDERAEVTPFPTKTYTVLGEKLPIGKMKFINFFFSDVDEFGDPLTDDEGEPLVKPFEKNGYLKFEYTRNKYPLRFNYDPSKIKGDSEFNSTNQLDTFYEFPLKALSPDLEGNEEYKKDNPANLLDDPEKLKELKLTDLIFTDKKDGKLKVKRPDNISDQMVFKGWALDPAGTKLIWENPGEKMPNHPVNLYAKWGEPDYKWKVTFDPNGGNLSSIDEAKVTQKRKTIQEGDIGQEEINTYAKKGYLKESATTKDGKQIFTVIQRQKLVEPKNKPTKKGFDFMGWEVIRYKKDPATGEYTDQIDNSYRETYKVPELYSFGNDVVAPVYLKAIWVPNDRVDVKVEHHILSLDLSKEIKMVPETLHNKRTGYLVATTGDQQDEENILATHEELTEKLTGNLKTLYEDYNDRVKANNTYFQTFKVEPEKIPDPNDSSKTIDNPKAKDNIFHFFYRPFRKREYKVNYIDERFKGKETQEGAAIIDQELVSNGNRHFDARNYRPIPGWVLTSAPQQQLFFDVNEKTNAFLGINGTGSDQIFFYYKDVRVIEIKDPNDPVPDGYVRVTFKADKGGAFTDKDGNSKTELYYDVIKGLKSDLLPVPEEWVGGKNEDGTEKQKEEGKYYITPEPGKKFTKWDNKPLLNKNTIVENDTKDFYVFTAKFEWSGLSASGLVRTEAFKDPNGKWTNDFAPKIEDLKKQLVWKEKDQVKDLPAGTVIKLYDEKGNELTTDDQVFALVTEKKAADKDELVRTVNVKAKVTFKDGKEPQELTIPITVYKNVYEALNKAGDKPLFLKEAEGKKAKDGGLSDVTGNYVKVTVQPTEKNTNKDAKVYYVNPKAWVNIPEVTWSQDDKDKTDFLKWTADKVAQNENKGENGIFDFSKRHKFTDEETLIKPLFTNDVVEQKEGEDKPKVPNNFVKVIVKTTDKATTESTQTFWVNPTKEVAITVAEPTGKTDQEVEITGLGKKKVNYIFKEWQKVQTGETDDSLTKVDPAVKIDLAKNQYTDKVTVIEAAYKKSIQAEPIVKPLKTTKLDTPKGKEITNDDLIKQITPQEGKEIESIEVISKPDGNTVGNEPAKVIVKYKDGTTQGTNDDPVVIPIEVHDNIIPAKADGSKPEKALENYVKVTFTAGKGGTVSGDLVYYVSPEVEVDMTDSAKSVTKTPEVGYYVNGEKWTNKDQKALKGTFTDPETKFVFTFDKSKDIVEKTDDPNQTIPADYVKVTFKTEDENKGKIAGDVKEKIYYVNPKAGIKLVELADGQTAGEKQLAVPTPTPNKNYVFVEWQEAIDQTTSITGNREYVATFKINKVTLTYVATGATKGTVPAALSYDIGTVVTLAGGNDLKKDNYVLKGWKIGDKTYKPGEKFTINDNTTATAEWDTDFHTVNFNTNGGGYIQSQKVKHGGSIEAITNPEKVNYTFTGWQVDGKAFDPATSKVEKDITLVAQYVSNVVEQEEPNTKPNVPDNFVKVIVKTTENDIEKATDATKFEKTFWVKKNTQVTIPVNPPIGDVVKDEHGNPVKDVSGKEVKWVFTDWTSPLTASFSQDETIITAKYESKVPEPTIDAKVVETYAGRKPELNDYKNAIKMQLGQDGITFDDNVLNFEITKNPDVSKPGSSEAEVTIEFKNGTTKTIKVPVKVNPNIYPADTDGGRTSETPKNYVRVIVNPTVLNADSQIRIYYVNPEVEIGIPLPAINPQNGAKFIAWHIEEGTRPEYNGEDYKFTQPETIIVADFDRAPGTGLIMTDVGVYPRPEDYKDRITVPQGKTIQDIKVIKKPNVDKPGITDATVEITYDDGKKDVVGFTVFVQAKYEPQPEPQPPIWSGGGVRYETIYKEKIVEVPTKINFFKEVRYMQGFQGYFRPKDGLRRCEAAQILANALKEDGYKYDLSYKINYKDIGNEWYTEAVKITTQANVFMGYSDGYFRPYDKITRAEWIATLRRFQNIDKVNGNHMNLRNDHWALAEIEGAYKEGWLKIYTDGLANFKADEFIPRQEVAAVSNRAFNRVCDRVYISRNDKNLINYKDINPSMWAYQDILCASNTFIHDKKNYRAHGIKDDKVTFNVNIDGLEILQSKFQRTLR